MPITFACPGCTASLTVADAAAGRAGKCPHCKGPIQVPADDLPILAVTPPASATVTTAPPPAAPADLHAQVLAQVLAQHGRVVCDDPRRLKALLADYLGKHPGAHDQPINLLVMALENRVVQDLLVSDALPGDMVQRRIAERLQSDLGLTPQGAQWSVAAWAQALGQRSRPAPAAVTPAVTQGGGVLKPITQPMAEAMQATEGPPAERFNSVTQPAAAWPMPAARPLGSRQPRYLILLGGGGGMLLVILLFMLFRSGGAAPPSATTVVSASTSAKSTAPAVPVSSDQSWKIIFRSQSAAIWNDDVRKGPDHFAMALELVPDNIRFLKLTNMASKEYVIIEMTKERIGKQSDDGRYGWDGRNAFDSGAHHLGIYYKIWGVGHGETLITWPGSRGWGFGHGHFIGGKQFYAWEGKNIDPAVFEIAVKSEPLTPAETKHWLKVGNPRQ